MFILTKTECKKDCGYVSKAETEILFKDDNKEKVRLELVKEIKNIYNTILDQNQNNDFMYFQLLDVELADIDLANATLREVLSDKRNEDFFVDQSHHIEDYINEVEYYNAWYAYESFEDREIGNVVYSVLEV